MYEYVNHRSTHEKKCSPVTSWCYDKVFQALPPSYDQKGPTTTTTKKKGWNYKCTPRSPPHIRPIKYQFTPYVILGMIPIPYMWKGRFCKSKLKISWPQILPWKKARPIQKIEVGMNTDILLPKNAQTLWFCLPNKKAKWSIGSDPLTVSHYCFNVETINHKQQTSSFCG